MICGSVADATISYFLTHLFVVYYKLILFHKRITTTIKIRLCLSI